MHQLISNERAWSYFFAPHFSAKKEEMMAEKWGAEKWKARLCD
jgi:hypothetical protein